MAQRIAKVACDACRQAKRKCEFGPNLSECFGCSELRRQCSFNLQRRKRGPKPRLAADGERHRLNMPAEHSPGSESTQSRISKAIYSTPQAPEPRTGCSSNVAVTDQQVAVSPQGISKTLNSVVVGFGYSIEELVKQWSELYMQWAFPSLPLIDLESLQDINVLSWSEEYHQPSPSDTSSESATTHFTMHKMRKFALLTSAYATVCVKVPSAVFPLAWRLVSPLLAASRSMLACYEDWDITMPDSSSLIIRAFHATVLHALGQEQLSWYIMGHAVRLAQAMHLFAEDSFRSLDAKESQLRRNIYWVLHTADKAASFIGGQPATLHQAYLRGSIKTKCKYQHDQLTLLNRGLDIYSWPYEEYVHRAFYLCHKLWALCDDILFSLELLGRLGAEAGTQPVLDGSNYVSVTDSYMDFCGILDEMPPWLCYPDSYNAPTETATALHRRAFWIQRTDLVITFHSLRYILLKQASDLKLSALLGITDSPGLVALRQIEIASDLAAAGKALPYESLRANGQSLVDKFRTVGASLSEVAQSSEKISVSSRAATLCSTFAELVASLDSGTSNSPDDHHGTE